MFLSNAIEYIKSIDNGVEIEIKLLLDNRIKYPHFLKQKSSQNLKIRVLNILQNAIQCGILKTYQTINFINTYDNGMFVKQLYFNNGVQDKDRKTFYYKTSLAKPFYMQSDTMTYKFTINQETDKPSDINTFDITRFRMRYTVNFTNDLSGWQLDLTFIKETKETSLNELRIIRDKLFKPKDFTYTNQSSDILIKHISDDFDWSYPDRIELEMEYIGDNKYFSSIEITKVLDAIKRFDIITPKDTKSNLLTYNQCICEIAKILKPHMIEKCIDGKIGLKQLGSNPIELSKELYIKSIAPNIQNFIITEKIDGVRSMLIIYPAEGLCYVINNKNKDGFSIKNITYDTNGIFKHIKCVILDTEAVDIPIDNTYITNYYIFDIIKYYVDSTDIGISLMPFNKRLGYIDLITKHSNEILVDGIKFLYSKHFKELTISYQDIRTFYVNMCKLPYDIDGVILISKNESYEKTMNYKWKPNQTIDFVVKKCPNNILGISPYITKENKTLYILFCGIREVEYKLYGIELFRSYYQMFPDVCYNKPGQLNDNYIPIQFAPSANPYAYLFWSENNSLNNKVVELFYDKEWQLYKVRSDRLNDLNRKTYYGNNFKVAETIWMNYRNPLTLDILCRANQQTTMTSYFTIKSTDYVAIRKFNNYVKKELINKFISQASWVIELASGKGQDLYKYIECGVQNLLMTDIDSNGLSEIINRKHSYITDCVSSRYGNKKHTPKESFRLYIQKLDLTDCYNINSKLIFESHFNVPSNGVKLVVCNLALHYIAINKTKSLNFTNFLNKILAPDGVFIFTAFSSEKVFNILESHSDETNTWNKYDTNGKLIYSIRKKYRGVFTGSDQQIDVLLPFTNGEYYTENLININVLNSQLEKKKISLISSDSFVSYINTFRESKSHFYEQLTEIDKEYLSLYHFYVYRKQPIKTRKSAK